MQRHNATVIESHQIADFGTFPFDLERTYVQRLLMNFPAIGFEHFAKRISGKNFRVLRTVAGIGLIGEAHDRVGSANPFAARSTEQAGTTQASLACQHIDAIAAKLLLDTLAIQKYCLGCASA